MQAQFHNSSYNTKNIITLHYCNMNNKCLYLFVCSSFWASWYAKECNLIYGKQMTVVTFLSTLFIGQQIFIFVLRKKKKNIYIFLRSKCRYAILNEFLPAWFMFVAYFAWIVFFHIVYWKSLKEGKTAKFKKSTTKNHYL